MKLLPCHCKPLIKAIDAYIWKADNELTDALEAEGYVEAQETVKQINDLEESVAGALIAETNFVVSSLKEFQEHPADYVKHVEESLDLDIYASYVWPNVKLTDELKPTLISIFREQFRTFMPYFVKRCIGRTDQSLGDIWDVIGPEGNGSRISKRTVAWIESWSEQLAEIMRLNSHTEIENILKKGLKEGVGIEEFTRRILESGIRDERYKARRVAITEVLTAHRMAQQEAFMQSPSVTEKMWKHTGAYRNEPRKNHVAMDGKRIPKEETFRLAGADGHIYFPMVPGDTILPAGERINCHCLCQPVVDKDILGMSLEERKRLQQQAIDEMDDVWEKELDARNKAKAGINSDTVKIDWIREKSHEDQIKYFGGGDAGKQRLALLGSGVITTDKELDKLYKVNARGIRVKKSLQELADDDIITINEDAVKHSCLGEYKPSSGRLTGGCHTSAGMAELDGRGITYNVTRTAPNGVRFGNVPNHSQKFKRTGEMQTWFPDNWDAWKVRLAGTAVANSNAPLQKGYYKVGLYDGVNIHVLFTNGSVSSVSPDYEQDI